MYYNIGSSCWSKIGTDAKTVADKTLPTMNLALNGAGFQPDYQKYLVIHEFGHSLGLEHEHQCSNFWSVASKFIDLNKMTKDPDMRAVNFETNMLEHHDSDSGETSPYDADSVMHYW